MMNSEELWQCGACTLMNSVARTICEVCGAKRPVQRPPAKPQQPHPPSSAKSKKSQAPRRRKKKKKGDTPSGKKRGSGGDNEKDRPAGAVGELMDMGFSKSAVVDALKATNNSKQQALDMLLSSTKPNGSSSSVASAPVASSTNTSSTVPKRRADDQGTRKSLTGKEKRVLAMRRQLEAQLAEEESSRKKAYVADELEKHNSFVEQAKERKKEEERRAFLEKMERERAYEAKKVAKQEERARRRREQERAIPDTDAALKYLEEHYDITMVKSLAKFCAKIVTNVLRAPHDEKYRSVRLDREIVQKMLVRPLGPMVMMRELGFVETQNAEGVAILYMAKANIGLLKSRLSMFQRILNQTATIVPHVFQECDQMGVSPELLYYAALDMRRIFQNVLTAGSESQSFRQIDTESLVYTKRLSRVPQLLALLEQFGYERESETSVFLEVRNPNLDMFEAAIGELTIELNKRAPQTPVAQGVRSLLKSNPELSVSVYVEKVDAAVSRIVNTPHEQKYHRIKLKPFFKRTGVVDGGKLFFRVLGFEVDDVAGTATMPYPHGFDPDLIEHRLNELRRAYKVELAAWRQASQ